MRVGRHATTGDSTPRPHRTLALIALFTLIFGAIGFGEIFDDGLRIFRNHAVHERPSGDIVIVGIDDKSLSAVGAWPWKRGRQAELINQLHDAGARRLVVDISYAQKDQDPAQDAALRAAFARAKDVWLPIHHRHGAMQGLATGEKPNAEFIGVARTATLSLYYNYQTAVWQLPSGATVGGRLVPSFASVLAGRENEAADSSFRIDYRLPAADLPYLSALDVLQGRAGERLKGKTVLLGTDSNFIGDQYLIPGDRRRGGMFVHALGGETLRRSVPTDLGWAPLALITMLIVGLALSGRIDRWRGALLGGTTVAVLALPLASETMLVFIDVSPALAALAATASVLGYRRFRARGLVNSLTGLPNLAALRYDRTPGDRALVVARVTNYASLAGTLDDKQEIELVRQIVARLSIGHETPRIYQGDEGIFAWLVEPGIAIGHHVEALHALFRSPARIGNHHYDLSLAFGVEIGAGRHISNRLGSALVAAEEAAAEGLKWKYYDPERLNDESWRLSLLARLEEAIERGEVWVAYQPQLDLKANRIRGAEALARWTHPEKGPISPAEFIGAAEAHGRIDRLTLFMLDQSIATAARINREGNDFVIAVNLSARTLQRRTLPDEVRQLLDQHGLKADRLVLELTETAALASDGSDLATLLELRELGVQLSIDDYGTGLSTLDYLKKVPAAEIKIDQSFVKAMRHSRSDHILVQSTIALAHSLSRVVIAEGVEDHETVEALRSMNCDAVQGFIVGRPTSRDGLLRRLDMKRITRAA